MNCAAGTICTPSGLTVEFRVQHDETVDGSGGRSAASALGQPLLNHVVGWGLAGGVTLWAML